MTAPPLTPEEIARWRELFGPGTGSTSRVVLILCDEVERLRADRSYLGSVINRVLGPASVHHWEADEYIVTTARGPIGGTLSKAEAELLRPILVSPPPRTEEEPAHDFYARGVHRQCRKCDLILLASEDAAKYPCEPAPALSQPQKATHPYEPCGAKPACLTIPACHAIVTEPRQTYFCNQLASDPIHAPAAHTEQP